MAIRASQSAFGFGFGGAAGEGEDPDPPACPLQLQAVGDLPAYAENEPFVMPMVDVDEACESWIGPENASHNNAMVQKQGDGSFKLIFIVPVAGPVSWEYVKAAGSPVGTYTLSLVNASEVNPEDVTSPASVEVTL